MLASIFALLSAPDTNKTEEFVTNFLKQSQVPALVGIIERGDDSETFAFGLADIEEKIPVKAEMLFDCGSIAKVWTTVVLLNLAEDKQIKLSDPVGKYVDEAREDWRKATVQQLLSHTAGLPEYVLYPGITLQSKFTLDKFFETMSDKPVDFAPGNEFQYSNTNFFMAQLIAERATKQKFADLLAKHVYKPANMTESGPMLSQEKIEKQKAQGHWIGNGAAEIERMPLRPDIGSGGHFTSVADLKKFSDALFGGKLLSKNSLKLMQTPASLPKGRKSQYGLGLFIRDVNGVKVMSHGGNSVGYAGSLTYIPSKQTTIVILGNAYQMSGDRTALAIAEQFYDDLKPVPFKEEKDPNPELSKKLLTTLHALAERKTDHELFSSEMRTRLERPRGQLGLGGFATFKDAEYVAFMGTESAEPDTIRRVKLKAGENMFVASFTLDSDGKIFTIAISRA